MSDYFKAKNANYKIPVNEPANYDGGRLLIERLIHLFNVKNRLELADLIGVTPGTLSTWTTRQTTPHELLVRVHLATGTPMEYLCFGTGKSFGMKLDEDSKTPSNKPIIESDEAYKLPLLNVRDINNGQLRDIEKLRVDNGFFSINSIQPNSGDFLLKEVGKYLFINSHETAVTKGSYLFSVNGRYQIGELRQLPDGKTYFYDDGEKHEINEDTTKIHGKVVSVLESM
jgi:hypothetical protein